MCPWIAGETPQDVVEVPGKTPQDMPEASGETPQDVVETPQDMVESSGDTTRNMRLSRETLGQGSSAAVQEGQSATHFINFPVQIHIIRFKSELPGFTRVFLQGNLQIADWLSMTEIEEPCLRIPWLDTAHVCQTKK